MKNLLILTSLIAGFFSFKIEAYPIFDKSIYGDDNRKLISELDDQYDEIPIRQSRAVLAQIPKWRVTSEDKATISVHTKSLARGMNFCPDEKFSNLPMVSSCSAFLVGSDLMLTAGHCVKDLYDCQNSYWILDYNDAAGFENKKNTAVFKKQNIVSCAQVLSWSQDPKLDYALIKIDRKITDRAPLKLRRKGQVSNFDQLMVIGHPMGLPKIIADQARVRDNSEKFIFTTEADTFSGNSGSPVINSATQRVEGILVKGENDFEMDIDLGCNRSYHCLGKECGGESVQRTTALPLKLIPKI